MSARPRSLSGPRHRGAETMRTLDEVLDRIETLTDDAFEWLESNVRRLAKRLTRRPNARPSRSVPSDDRGKVDATGRRD
jgi:hypothetical protein